MRARNLKPGYFKNEVLGSADPICGHVFQGLWGLADREGRLEFRLQRIHIEINAYRDIETTRCAIEWLIENAFVVRYHVNGEQYLAVTNFRDHQHPHVKEPPSKLPGPGSSGGGTGGAPGKHRTGTGPAPGQHQTRLSTDGSAPSSAQQASGIIEESRKPGASTGPAPGQHQTSPVQERRIPDSGLLKPDSGLLTPEGQEPLSGKEPEPVVRRDFNDLRRAVAGRMRMPGT